MTISARSTSMRSTSSRRISVSSRSNGPANTSRSSSRSTRRTVARLPAGPDCSEAHRLAHVPDRVGGDGPRLLGPRGEDPLELRDVTPQLAVALAHRRQVVDHRIGHGLLEGSVARPVEGALDL